MNRNLSVPLAFVLALAPGIAFASSQSGQQPQPAVESSHSLMPTAIEPSNSAVAKPAEQPASTQELYRNCQRLISQARDNSREVVRMSTVLTFNPDRTIEKHKQLAEALGNLKQEHQRFYESLSSEKQNTVTSRNTNLMQAHDRLQKLAQQMQQELSDSTLHSKDIAEQARTTNRELKGMEKEFRAMGSTLGLVAN